MHDFEAVLTTGSVIIYHDKFRFVVMCRWRNCSLTKTTTGLSLEFRYLVSEAKKGIIFFDTTRQTYYLQLYLSYPGSIRLSCYNPSFNLKRICNTFKLFPKKNIFGTDFIHRMKPMGILSTFYAYINQPYESTHKKYLGMICIPTKSFPKNWNNFTHQ